VQRFPYSLLLLILLVFGSSGWAQNALMPSNWTSIEFPAASSETSDTLLCANYSTDEWHLTMDSGALRISQSMREPRTELPKHFAVTKEMKGSPVVAKSSDGWLVGFDNGEFTGGGLWWVSENGRESRQVSDENVHAILSRGDGSVVLTGIARLSVDEGTAYSYNPITQALTRIADLGSSPAAALVQENGTVVIAAQTRVLEIDKSNQLRVLLFNQGMHLLYPNSVVEDPSGDIFVGMRFYVLQLRHKPGNNYEPEWYVPGRCIRTEIKDSRCVCTAR
jgi:hypothetical protein